MTERNTTKKEKLVEVEDRSIKCQIISLLRKTKREGIESLIEYLEESDFFSAPASSIYHGNFEGGLAEHSLNVLDALISLTTFYNKEYGTPEYEEDVLIIVGLLHDMCKINSYVQDFRNVKNDKGVWEKVPCYRREQKFTMGHGAKSVFLIQKFIDISLVEAQAIYWHLGALDISNYSSSSELFNAIENNFLTLALQQADMFAAHIMEVKIDPWRNN
jgi:hypothetical protein